MMKLYVDGFIFKALYDKFSHLEDKISAFIDASYRSSYEPVIFIDAMDGGDEDEIEWKKRQLSENEEELIPNSSYLIGEIFRKYGIEVRYSIDHNDDVLAFYAENDNATILSIDYNLLCYQPRTYKVAQSYSIIDGELVLKQIFDYSPHKQRLLKPLPVDYPRYDDQLTYPYILNLIKGKTYIRGILGPISYLKQFDNPRIQTIPYMKYVFERKGFKQFKYCFPGFKDNAFYWKISSVNDHALNFKNMTFREITQLFITDNMPMAYRKYVKCAIAELYAIDQNVSLLDLFYDYIFKDSNMTNSKCIIKDRKKDCSVEDCSKYAVQGGVCVAHGARKKRCSVEDCEKYAVQAGVCIGHGAKRKYSYCSVEGCGKYAKKSGVCVGHGPSSRRCSVEGCPKQAQTGGLCIAHGASHRRCSVEDCSKQAQTGGLCTAHGASSRRCSVEDCKKYAVKSGVCIAHGARPKVKRCSVQDCEKYPVQGGICIAHGAKVKRCSVEGCEKYPVQGGICIAHGARKKRCSAEGCNKQTIQGGVCIAHGAKVKRCSAEGCDKQVIQGGVCIGHGAEVKRCSSPYCENYAVRGGVCIGHGAITKRCSVNGCGKYAVRGGTCINHRYNW